MKTYFAGRHDVAVIGAGHAGIEAALASARLGCSTMIFAINLDSVGNMPCNPSIGGTAKGHLVREIDALGGEMGKAADATTLQIRMLNMGKGPAVQSLRAQIDRRKYSEYMKHAIERQKNLQIKQGEIVDIVKSGDKWLLTTNLGAEYEFKAVIFATGTFLGGKIFVGEVNFESGPDGMFAATKLSSAMGKLGIQLRRFKTGTPARVHKRSVNFSLMEEQPGDEGIYPFSYSTASTPENKVMCHIAYTNDKTKQVILENLDRSPLFSGVIHGVGPRYCPSIEDKIVRFADKERHQLFVEPCGENTEEMYLQGMSSSLPEEVQVDIYRSIKGLENVEIMRSAYAIEYDCIDPNILKPTLELKEFSGLYGAGQFNGSSGYEEAAAQGLVAGINAALKIKGEEEFVLPRSSSYIGTLIDDLCVKGCSDPYRMMTSRSEYRLLLRQDNADERLTPLARKAGMITDDEWNAFNARIEQKNAEIERLEHTHLGPSEALNKMLEEAGTAPLSAGASLASLIRRPQITYDMLAPFDKERKELLPWVSLRVETEIKYDGYIKKQIAAVKEQLRLEEQLIPENIDYSEIKGLRLEATEKLNKIKPRNIGMASRISGVSPADITVLLIRIKELNS